MADSDVNPQHEEWMALLNELENYEPPKKVAARPVPAPPLGSVVEPAPATPPPVAEMPKAVVKAVEEIEGAARAPEAEVRSRLSKYDELRKKPSMTMKVEDLKVWDELSEIMGSVNRAVSMIESFRRDFGDKIPIEKFDAVGSGLKDVSTVMFREFHALRHGKRNKTYDKKNVCTKCHSVFMEPLPEGICDECRSNTKPFPGAGEY